MKIRIAIIILCIILMFIVVSVINSFIHTDIDKPEKSDVIIEEYEATSTYTNATESLNIMDDYGFNSALVATTDYHLKRSKMIYERVNNGECDLKYVAVLGPNGEKWGERPDRNRIWSGELYKLWGYRLALYNIIDEPDD